MVDGWLSQGDEEALPGGEASEHAAQPFQGAAVDPSVWVAETTLNLFVAQLPPIAQLQQFHHWMDEYYVSPR